MKLDRIGEQFIKGDEELRLKPYKDSAGVWTIGWGHTDGVIEHTPEITSDMAEKLFEDDLYPAERTVNHEVNIPLSQNEYNALVSFCFNVGCQALKRSTLLKLLNNGDRQGAAREFDKFIYVHNEITHEAVVNDGLKKRRDKEKALFLKDFLAKRQGDGDAC